MTRRRGLRPPWSPPSLRVVPGEIPGTAPGQDWSAVQEWHRRDRAMHDLLARSGSTRLHVRVTTPPSGRQQWRAAERAIVAAERAIRALDPQASGFLRDLEQRRSDLTKAYSTAGIQFVARTSAEA